MAAEVDDETLNQYLDGELSEEKATLVRMVLEGSETDRARLARLRRVGDLVRVGAQDVGLELDSETLFASIQRGIKDQTDAGFGEGFKVIEGGDERAAPVERWKVIVPVVVAGFAAAAALVFAFVAPVERPGNGRLEPSLATIETSLGSEVEAVDFGANTGTVFAVKGEAGEPLAVVWLNDEGAEAR